MAWTDLHRVKVAELLEKFAQLYAKMVELKVRQQYQRAKQQGIMLKALKGKEKEK